MALRGPDISPPTHSAGRLLEEGSVIQLPLYKFYYMALGMAAESAVSNEELVVPDSLLRLSAAAHQSGRLGRKKSRRQGCVLECRSRV